MAIGYFILEIIPSWSDLVEVVLVTLVKRMLESKWRLLKQEARNGS